MGGPGIRRRELALSFMELTEREIEFVALTRDTTEADLKQRREIKSGTAYYHDQSAVRAAINGRVLIIEGVEKAERNVLPVLNNLLENREMHLEDGRFLIPASRYDKLLKVIIVHTFLLLYIYQVILNVNINYLYAHTHTHKICDKENLFTDTYPSRIRCLASCAS